jgi:hypothetical protein
MHTCKLSFAGYGEQRRRSLKPAALQGVRKCRYYNYTSASYDGFVTKLSVRAHMIALATFHPAVLALLALVLLSGCAATSPNALPKYQPPRVGQPAATIDVGKHGHAWSVDGAETPSFAQTLRLVPGEHRVGINCLSFEIEAIGILPSGPRAPAIPVGNVKTALQFVLVTGPFEAGKTYYTRCVAVDGQPHAWLADAPTGSDLPKGFTSICTRECPR